MTTMLKPKVGQADELVKDLPGAVGEVLADQRFSPALTGPGDLVAAAHGIAKALHACGNLSERIKVYKDLGQRFGSEWRRVLNIAYSRWPELMPMLNGEQELIALLSADLS